MERAEKRKPSWRRRLAAAAVAALASVGLVALPAAPSTALSGSEFMPGLIISDALFYDANAMTEAQIQMFLASKGAGIAGYTFTVASRPAVYSERTGNLVCQPFQGGTLIPASTIIFRAQQACGISAKVLLVTLQKEQGLITKATPSQYAMDRAMGYACPDTAPCAPTTLGFGNQVYAGAQQLVTYKLGRFARQPGTQTIQFNPSAGCGSTTLNIQNYATAALYNYTPYQPNAAALANLYGTGDSCSSYGNRNFWVYYQSWFGSTFGNGPYPIQQPGISGSTSVGEILTVQPGNWAGSPSFSYTWMACDTRPDFFDGVPAGCVARSSTSTTYVTAAEDVGKYVAATVLGTNSYGTMRAGTSMLVRIGTPSNLVPPKVSGVPAVGSTLTVDIGTWGGTPAPSMAIYWLRCDTRVPNQFTVVPSGCAPIDGARAATYAVTGADSGKFITAQVAGNNPLGFALAGPPATVPIGFPTNLVPPTVSGVPGIGTTWSVDVGQWVGSPAPTLAIHWLRCDSPITAPYDVVPPNCSVIPGAVATTYVSTLADSGKYLTAQVAGNSPLGFSIAGALNSVAIVSNAPANTVPPTVSGAAAVGSTWTVDVGTWTGSPAPTFAIYWLRCDAPVTQPYTTVPAGCAVIKNAVATTYVSTLADVGKYLTAQVAGNSPVGFSIAGPVNTLATVGNAPANTVPPTVSGAAAVGSTWTVNVGTWTGNPAPTFAIHWLRCDAPVTQPYTTVPDGCAVIKNAVATTYVSTPADSGKYLTAQVAGNSPLGFSIAGPINTLATQ